MDDTYNWNPLGRSWWARAALECNATPLQARFACAKLRGRNHAAAAREAGVGRTAKQQGFEMSGNPKVVAMLAMAATANGGRPKRLEQAQTAEGEMTGVEAKSILTTIGRGTDPVLAIRSIEALQKIAEQESQRERREYSMDEALEASFKAAGVYGPQFIAESFFSRHKSLPWGSDAFTDMAPKLATAFPDRWRHFRDQLPGHRLKFEEVGIA